jgi:hypothetical protein
MGAAVPTGGNTDDGTGKASVFGGYQKRGDPPRDHRPFVESRGFATFKKRVLLRNVESLDSSDTNKD